MIRINIDYIANWKKIKECHTAYIEKVFETDYKKTINQEGCDSKSIGFIVDFLKQITLNLNKNNKEFTLSESDTLENKELTKEEFTEIAFLDYKLMRDMCSLYNKLCADKAETLSEKISVTDKIIERKELIKFYLQKIFKYDGKFNSNGLQIKIDTSLGNSITINWNRNKLIDLLGLRICPYCNRQYINSYISDDIAKNTSQTDHFISQSKYPFLALSLLNLVPSCSFCNLNKSDTTEAEIEGNLLYPYEKGFDDYNVAFTIIEAKDEYGDDDTRYLSGTSMNFDILLSSDRMDIKNNIDIFHLDDIYKTHKTDVKKLIQKNNIYTKEMIEHIKNKNSNLFNDVSEIENLIFDTCRKKNYLEQPLSKFNNDILNELKLKMPYDL